MELTDKEILEIGYRHFKPNHNAKAEANFVAAVRDVLAAHNAGAQEPVAWRVSGTYTNGLHFSHLYDDKVTAEKSAASAAMRTLTPLYAHPQPITDAARDAKRYQAIRAKVLPFNAYASGNPNWTFPDYGPRGATFDEAIDAEIERLDRAKGE